MNDPPQPRRKTIRDYCRRIDVGHTSLIFQLANHVALKTKNGVLVGLRDNMFDGQTIYGVEDTQIKMRSYEVSLIRRKYEGLHCLTSGIIQTWTKLYGMFLEIFFYQLLVCRKKD